MPIYPSAVRIVESVGLYHLRRHRYYCCCCCHPDLVPVVGFGLSVLESSECLRIGSAASDGSGVGVTDLLSLSVSRPSLFFTSFRVETSLRSSLPSNTLHTESHLHPSPSIRRVICFIDASGSFLKKHSFASSSVYVILISYMVDADDDGFS